MEIFGQTDIGCVRRANQDVFGVRECDGGSVGVVCDGMGGAKAGEVASAIALDVFTLYMEELLRTPKFPNDAAEKIAIAATLAGNAVYERAETDPECEGMGTTLVAAVVRDDLAIVANVGDSRAYHVSDGKILRVTRDHSVVEEMVARGEITRDEARFHPSRNLITRALGTARNVPADVFYSNVHDGDFLVLCSDGLSNLLSDAEILALLSHDGSACDLCAALVDSALDRGAPDNVTVIVIKV
ncbi:MAG: Stp1/IreP family PP2C-type Ser/Thr phosphatase [Oscillospiraceae bacterium]|jgi:protein phosphatase|nr:Stp1/IreP family PP2C-type Ser/Thr phosphatase [Oscillospiraceae bacterium]